MYIHIYICTYIDYSKYALPPFLNKNNIKRIHTRYIEYVGLF